jgi:hypothetical protein
MSDLHELAKRAVACKGWRWMPGMLASDAGGNQHRVIEHHAGREYITTVLRDYDDAHTESSARAVDLTPVLDDPATMGCLLALVRKAWGRPFWVEGDTRSMGERPDEWIGVLFEGRFATCPVVHASTEAEALVAALEAAP